jgi:gas vesicle protein
VKDSSGKIFIGMIIGFAMAMIIADLNGLNNRPWRKS